MEGRLVSAGSERAPGSPERTLRPCGFRGSATPVAAGCNERPYRRPTASKGDAFASSGDWDRRLARWPSSTEFTPDTPIETARIHGPAISIPHCLPSSVPRRCLRRRVLPDDALVAVYSCCSPECADAVVRIPCDWTLKWLRWNHRTPRTCLPIGSWRAAPAQCDKFALANNNDFDLDYLSPASAMHELATRRLSPGRAAQMHTTSRLVATAGGR